MKTLQDFKNSELVSKKLNKIFGLSGGIVDTPGGEFQGMKYDRDYFHDDDRDGEWGRGESIVLINCEPAMGNG